MAKVVIANGLTLAGKKYKGGEIADIPSGQARDLIKLGKARPYVPAAAVAVRAAVKGGK